MTTRCTLALVALALAWLTCGLHAQATIPRGGAIDYASARLEAEGRQNQPANAVAPGEPSSASAAETDHLVWSLRYRERTFEWQYYSTIVIFFAVILLIACGLYFSYMQFTSAKKAPTQTSIKIGRDGLEINSPVIGLLILFISLGFFYLYLANVYPITEIGSAPAPASEVSR